MKVFSSPFIILFQAWSFGTEDIEHRVLFSELAFHIEQKGKS
jgi:hypothetical protein